MIFNLFKKIKNSLFNKKLALILLCFFVILGLLFPLDKAKAILGTGLFDFFETALGGIEEKVGPISGKVIAVFFLYIIGLGLLYASSYLLQLVITESASWLVIQESALVKAGFGFVAGLANLFLILIFVIIAIAYILKNETFQAKKALPRLIIVALLLNFSLVFVGALVDVSNVLYTTVLGDNEDIIMEFINELGSGIQNNLVTMGVWIAILAGLWMIPFIGPFAQLAFVTLVTSLFFLPNILTWIFQLIISFMISGLFFLYVFLFAARIFIIQILAILSPIAFICLILPQTRKYWKEWLQYLIEWIFLGIIVLFFLVIGLRAAKALVPPGGITPQPQLFQGWIEIAPYFVYYFFIFIYLILVAWLSKKFMPALAGTIIAQATGWGGRVRKDFAEPYLRQMRTSFEETVAPVRKKLERVPVIGRALGGPGAFEAEQKKRTAKERKKIEDRPTDALHEIAEMRPLRREDYHRIVAALERLAEKGKLTEEEVRSKGHFVKEYGGDTAKIARALPHLASYVDEETKDIIQKQRPRSFRRNTQPEALKTTKVIVSMDSAKFYDIRKRGSTAQKEAIAEAFDARLDKICDELDRLRRQGEITEKQYWERIRTLSRVIHRPEFQR